MSVYLNAPEFISMLHLENDVLHGGLLHLERQHQATMLETSMFSGFAPLRKVERSKVPHCCVLHCATCATPFRGSQVERSKMVSNNPPMQSLPGIRPKQWGPR